VHAVPAVCASGSAAPSRLLVLPGWPGYDPPPPPPPHTTLTRLQRALLLPLLRRVCQHGLNQQGQVGADMEGGASSYCCRIQARLRGRSERAGWVAQRAGSFRHGRPLFKATNNSWGRHDWPTSQQTNTLLALGTGPFSLCSTTALARAGMTERQLAPTRSACDTKSIRVGIKDGCRFRRSRVMLDGAQAQRTACLRGWAPVVLAHLACLRLASVAGRPRRQAD